jgi:hypothetical protein
MNYEMFYSQEGNFSGWRCIFCGDIIDPTVLENRKSSKLKRKDRKA